MYSLFASGSKYLKTTDNKGFAIKRKDFLKRFGTFATFIAWKLTVINAMVMAISPPKIKGTSDNWILYTKSSNDLLHAHQTIGDVTRP